MWFSHCERYLLPVQSDLVTMHVISLFSPAISAEWEWLCWDLSTHDVGDTKKKKLNWKGKNVVLACHLWGFWPVFRLVSEEQITIGKLCWDQTEDCVVCVSLPALSHPCRSEINRIELKYNNPKNKRKTTGAIWWNRKKVWGVKSNMASAWILETHKKCMSPWRRNRFKRKCSFVPVHL